MKEFLTIFVPTIKRNAFTTKDESYEKVTINKNKNSNYLKTPVLYKYRCFFCACFIHFVMWRERQAVRWERTVGRSVGDRPQAGGVAQRGFVGIRGGLPVVRPIAHNGRLFVMWPYKKINPSNVTK